MVHFSSNNSKIRKNMRNLIAIGIASTLQPQLQVAKALTMKLSRAQNPKQNEEHKNNLHNISGKWKAEVVRRYIQIYLNSNKYKNKNFTDLEQEVLLRIQKNDQQAAWYYDNFLQSDPDFHPDFYMSDPDFQHDLDLEEQECRGGAFKRYNENYCKQQQQKKNQRKFDSYDKYQTYDEYLNPKDQMYHDEKDQMYHEEYLNPKDQMYHDDEYLNENYHADEKQYGLAEPIIYCTQQEMMQQPREPRDDIKEQEMVLTEPREHKGEKLPRVFFRRESVFVEHKEHTEDEQLRTEPLRIEQQDQQLAIEQQKEPLRIKQQDEPLAIEQQEGPQLIEQQPTSTQLIMQQLGAADDDDDELTDIFGEDDEPTLLIEDEPKLRALAEKMKVNMQEMKKQNGNDFYQAQLRNMREDFFPKPAKLTWQEQKQGQQEAVADEVQVMFGQEDDQRDEQDEDEMSDFVVIDQDGWEETEKQ